MMMNAKRALAFWKNWRTSMMILINMEFSLSSRTMSSWPMKLVFSHSQPWSTTRQAFRSCMMVSLGSSKYLESKLNNPFCFAGNLKNENRVLQWLINQKSKRSCFQCSLRFLTHAHMPNIQYKT